MITCYLALYGKHFQQQSIKTLYLYPPIPPIHYFKHIYSSKSPSFPSHAAVPNWLLLWPFSKLADNNSMSTEINWYIQFDNKTFTFLNKPKYDKYIFKAAELFVNAAVCEPSENIVVSQWVSVLSNAVRDISQLMYNFFYVEEKLADQEIIKVAFYQIHTVLKVENLYSNFFYIASQNFRISRILACMIRLNRFLQALFEHIVNIKKNLDSTFLQNLDEVYIFIQQKLKQTLSKTQVLGNHDINIILLDTLSLILRNFGDTTMHKILDKTKVGHIIEMIEKENQVYQEYEEFKQKDVEEFKEHHEYIKGHLDPEEDPRIKQREVVEVEEDD